MNAQTMVTDCLDLVLARACLGCGSLGRVLCEACLARLRGRVHASTSAQGLTVHAALPYDDGGGELVIAYKDRGNRALAPMLGTLLADAVEAALRDAHLVAAQVVPVPPHPWSERGFDAVAGILRYARRTLLVRGLDVHVVRPVRAHGHRAPMKTLSGRQRRELRGALFRPARLRTFDRTIPVVIVDDVITTGTTLQAVRSVLDAMGADTVGAAAVTSVERPHQPG